MGEKERLQEGLVVAHMFYVESRSDLAFSQEKRISWDCATSGKKI